MRFIRYRAHSTTHLLSSVVVKQDSPSVGIKAFKSTLYVYFYSELLVFQIDSCALP